MSVWKYGGEQKVLIDLPDNPDVACHVCGASLFVPECYAESVWFCYDCGGRRFHGVSDRNEEQ